MRPEKLDILLSPITKLNGIGPKLEKIINKLGIYLNIHLTTKAIYNHHKIC